MTYRYEIAGLKVETDGDFNEFAQDKMKAYEKDFEGKADINITVKLNQTGIKVPQGETVFSGKQRHYLRLKDGGIAFYDYVPQISDEIINLVTITESFSSVKMELCRSDVLGLSVDERPFNLLDRVMRLLALKHNRVVLHASAISYRNNGILFSAASGTGKSTHTSLWKQFYPETVVFNDDAPIISFEDGVVYACGSPWCGTSGLNSNLKSPLKAIVFLKQAKECSIRKVGGAEAVFMMYREINKPVFDDLMELMLEKISKILEEIPTYELSCDISKEAVNVVKSELEL